MRKVEVNGQALAVPYVPVHLRYHLMQSTHEVLGHLRSPSLLDALLLQGWWPTIAKDFSNFHKECTQCKLYDSCGKSSVHPRHPLPVPAIPFHTWHIDWIQDLPTSTTGNCNLLVAIDSATRFMMAKAYSTRDAEAQIDFLYELMIRRGFGAPKVLISDRAASFVSSAEFKKFCGIHHIENRFTSSYHPETNGRVERLNQLIGKMLSKFCAGDVSRWDKFVDAVCFNLNIRKHTVTNYSPSFLGFGLSPRLSGNLTNPQMYDLRQAADCDAYENRELTLLGHARSDAFQKSLRQARQMVTVHETQNVTQPAKFKIGDQVKLKRQRLPAMFIGKLEPKWDGPYETEYTSCGRF